MDNPLISCKLHIIIVFLFFTIMPVFIFYLFLCIMTLFLSNSTSLKTYLISISFYFFFSSPLLSHTFLFSHIGMYLLEGWWTMCACVLKTNFFLRWGSRTFIPWSAYLWSSEQLQKSNTSPFFKYSGIS